MTPPKTGSGQESGHRSGQGSGIQNGITNIIDEVQGDGIFLNPYEGKGLSDLLRSILKKDENRKNKKPLKEVFKKLKVKVKVTRYGIFLQPFPT